MSEKAGCSQLKKSKKGKEPALPPANKQSGSKGKIKNWQKHYTLSTLTAGWIDKMLLPALKNAGFEAYLADVVKNMRVGQGPL